MQETSIESVVTPYACPIAGKTVYIRLVPGATWASANPVCDNQYRCIAAKRGECVLSRMKEC
jgi:hypothetical protein